MSRTLKRAVFAMLGAMVMLIASAASAGAGGSPGSSVLVRIESASQKEILAGDSRLGSRTRARGARLSGSVAPPAPSTFRISRG